MGAREGPVSRGARPPAGGRPLPRDARPGGRGAIAASVGLLVRGETPSPDWGAVTFEECPECLTGALPFPIESTAAWRRLVLGGRPTPLAKHLDGIPTSWQGFFDRALAADRSMRPRKADQFFRQLEQALR